MVGRGFCFEICGTGTVTLVHTSVPDGLRGRSATGLSAPEETG